ncbi:hypothetical protein P7D22_19740 [Lichenihabitans sp. Uapishka_5]|uniref:hypothetical protein n=1 Tax=Lichenihabitans sp. Uapishka_5 TaxID=3037302 RepID=UPI0029E82073|nr:hypothetical protein [Lichenihabitans sp. Uapishka_5]MDX7953401.1 hypothetical protein [Lichenihabitans sp. Uapishka_5]
MSENGESRPKQSRGGRPPKGKSGTFTFRVTAALREMLEADANFVGRPVSEIIERRLMQSFNDMQTIADQRSAMASVEGIALSLREQLSAFGTDANDLAAVKAFAAILRATQKRHGKSWREGDYIPWVVTEATRRLMVSQVRSPLFEALAPFRLPNETEVEASAMGEVAQNVFTFPPLPEIAPQDDPQNWTGLGRHVVTFRDKVSGEVLEVVTVQEGAWDKLATMPPTAAFLAAVEQWRPRRDEIEVENSFVHLLKTEQSVWDSKPAENLREVSAIPEHPAELFDKSDLYKAMAGHPGHDGPSPRDRDDDSGAGSPIKRITPARSRRKVKA